MMNIFRAFPFRKLYSLMCFFCIVDVQIKRACTKNGRRWIWWILLCSLVVLNYIHQPSPQI